MSDTELQKLAKRLARHIDVELGTPEDVDENFVFDQIYAALRQVRDAQKEKTKIGMEFARRVKDCSVGSLRIDAENTLENLKEDKS